MVVWEARERWSSFLSIKGLSMARLEASPRTRQATTLTSSVDDALRLGCVAVGFTIYPGSSQAQTMYEQAREITKEAKSKGLAMVLWSYPRGSDPSKEGETAIDVVAYAAQIAAQLGAHIIKTKLRPLASSRKRPR